MQIPTIDLSALIVPVYFPSPIIEQIRQEYTVDGQRGMPSHFSIVYPFVKDLIVYKNSVKELRSLFQSLPLQITFSSLLRNDSKRLLYLQPDLEQPLKEWIQEANELFGIPLKEPFVHLTLAKTRTLNELNNVEIIVRNQLDHLFPITIKISEVSFYAECNKNWKMIDSLNF